MQNLREKLLKAGLVDKKKKKQADHQARLKRTKERHQGVDPELARAQKATEFEEQLNQRRLRDRERERAENQKHQELATQKAIERQRQETARKEEAARLDRQHQAQALLQGSLFLPRTPGPVAFHFVSRSGAIRSLGVSTQLALELSNGRLAIAQLPGYGAERFGLVHRDVAERLLEGDPSLVRFLVAEPQQEMAPLPVPAATKPPRRSRPRPSRHFGPGKKALGDRRER